MIGPQLFSPALKTNIIFSYTLFLIATAGKGGGSRSPEGSGGDYVMEAPTGISMPNRPFMQDTGLLGLHEAEVDEMAIRYAREEALLRSVRARALEDELARRRK